jgi:hypothetical protein
MNQPLESTPIDDYLDQLFVRLRGTPRHARRVLAETEEHLRDSAAAQRDRGVPHAEAERQAIAAFGPVDLVATIPAPRVPYRRIVAAAVASAWSLTAAGLIAIGLSGLIAAVMNASLGRAFVGGDSIGGSYSAAACRHVLQLWPDARNCAQASVLENSADAVSLRGLAGIAGVVLGLLYLLWRRRHPGPAIALPVALPPAVAVTVFGSAATLLLGQSADLARLGRHDGIGFYLSGGLVALVATLIYGVRLVQALRDPRELAGVRPG